jgi:hypothetical protein
LAVISLVGCTGLLLPQTTVVSATTTTPRWVKHVERYPGGISNGVRAQLSGELIAARAKYAGATAGATEAPRSTVPRDNVQMNDDSNPPVPQNETSVAYNTDNPLIAVAAANDYVSGGVAVMRTSDGGRTWKTTRISPQFVPTRDFCTGGDPSIAYSRRDQAFLLSQLCFFRTNPASEVQVYKSGDNGKTWTPGRQSAVAVTNFDEGTGQVDDSVFYDKEQLTIDNTPTSPHYGRLYVTYTKFHYRPDGFGDFCPIQAAWTDFVPTFNPALTVFSHTPVVPDDPKANGLGRSANQSSQPVAAPDGTLYVSYVGEDCNTGLDHHLYLQRSKDGGRTFRTQAFRIDKPGQFHDNPDPGDLLPNKAFRAPLAPSLDLNVATGTLTYAYADYSNGAVSGSDIALSRSTDGGRTWSDKQVISQRSNGEPALNDQFFVGLDSDPTGNLHAVWLDNRRDPANHNIDTCQALSVDDGRTWKDFRISTESWDPDRGFFQSGAFIGDYIGLAAASNVIYPIWPDGRASAIDRTGIGETDIFNNVTLR